MLATMSSKVNKVLDEGDERSSNIIVSRAIDEQFPITQLMKKRKEVIVGKDDQNVEERKQKRRRNKRSIIKLATTTGYFYKEILTNCKPQLFWTNGKEKLILTPAQVRDVKEVGFGGLLELNCGKIPDGIIPFLVSNFDTDNRLQVIGNNHYFLTADDVYDILCLPLNPCKPIISHADKDDKLVKEWMTLLGVSKASEFRATKISPLFERYPDGGVIFKKLFVMYSVGMILAPLPDFRLRKQLLSVVENVDTINTFDWCTYVLDILVDSIYKVMKGSCVKNVNGCVLVLLGAYCYRFPFQGKRYPRSLPLIKHLTNEKLMTRVNSERKSGFGTRFAELSDFPISHVYNDWCQGIGVDVEVEKPHQRREEHGVVFSHGDKQRCVTYPLPTICHTDEEIKHIAKDAKDEADMYLKRDMKVIMHAYMRRVAIVESKKYEDYDVGASEDEVIEVLSQTQKSFMNDEWLASVDAFCDIICKYSKLPSTPDG